MCILSLLKTGFEVLFSGLLVGLNGLNAEGVIEVTAGPTVGIIFLRECGLTYHVFILGVVLNRVHPNNWL